MGCIWVLAPTRRKKAEKKARIDEKRDSFVKKQVIFMYKNYANKLKKNLNAKILFLTNG